MEQIITGCKDCPLFDCTGSEYGTYCHHPKRPLTVHVHDMDNNYADVEPTEKEIKDYIENYLRGYDNEDAYTRIRNESWEQRRYPGVDEPIIEDDDKYNPITPDWCPLNKEPITIIKKQ